MNGLKEAVEYGVIGLLVGLSLWAVAVAIERWWCYRNIDVRGFASIEECEISVIVSLLPVRATVRLKMSVS